jgi:hypothetical protein
VSKIIVTLEDWTGSEGCGIVWTTDSTNFEVFSGMKAARIIVIFFILEVFN